MSTTQNGTKKRGAAGVVNGHGGEDSKRPRLAEKTDRTRWRMKADNGMQTWHYLEDDEQAAAWPQTYADKWYLRLPTVRAT